MVEDHVPLFDMDDKELIQFAYKMKNNIIMDTVAPEMTRRMIVSIKEFNKKSSEESNKMINLTYWIMGLTFFIGILALIEFIKLVR